MSGALARVGERLHGAIAAAAVWLVATSPLVAMLRRVPRDPSLWDYGHLALGLAAVPLGLLYLHGCSHDGRWRLYFPWLAGDLGPTARDLAGLLRGQRPAAEGGGLFAVIEGLALVAFVATALSGVGWLLAQGAPAALEWRAAHAMLAWTCAALAGLHVVTVALHLRDLA